MKPEPRLHIASELPQQEAAQPARGPAESLPSPIERAAPERAASDIAGARRRQETAQPARAPAESAPSPAEQAAPERAASGVDGERRQEGRQSAAASSEDQVRSAEHSDDDPKSAPGEVEGARRMGNAVRGHAHGGRRKTGPASRPHRALRLRSASVVSDGFSRDQLKKLVRNVDGRHIQTRELDGKRLTYIEGWYAIAQANAIFGHAGWDREMVHFERVMERTRSDAIVTCGYMARVRIRVRAGSTEVIREGTGWGSAAASTATAANERALKSAETDATKRALSTFGASFGLSLYDKDHIPAKARPVFALFAPDGTLLDDALSAEAYSTGLRQLIEICKDTHQVDQLSRHNRTSLADLRIQVPTLRNGQGVHFADLLLRLMQRRRERVSGSRVERTRSGEPGSSPHDDGASTPNSGTTSAERSLSSEIISTPTGSGASARDSGTTSAERSQSREIVSAPARPEAPPKNEPKPESVPESGQLPQEAAVETAAPALLPPSKITHGWRIDKSKLLLGLERRIRDKAHLRRVAELPCLVCNRQPSHAHHLRFAQRRGLSQKVSDEFVVPLCALHHGDLHRSSSEQDWWAKQKIEPVTISGELWARTHRM